MATRDTIPFPQEEENASTFCGDLSQSCLFDNEQDAIHAIDYLADNLNQWMALHGYRQAQLIMDRMLNHKSSALRHDGVTPAALHELTQAVWFISCVEDGLHVEDAEGVLSVIFSHDLGEDYGETPESFDAYLTENGITNRDAIERFKRSFDVITKQYRNPETDQKGPLRHANNSAYNDMLVQDREASVAKMFDRPHNIMTLIGAKEHDKILSYMDHILEEQDQYVLAASINFPEQSELYETLRYLTENEAELTREKIDLISFPYDDSNTFMPEKGFKDMPFGLHPRSVIMQRLHEHYPDIYPADNPDGQQFS